MDGYTLSYWEKKTFLPDFDLVIIGAGIVGLNAAISAKTLKPDWKIAIIERGFLPAGASTRNAGFACFGSLSEIWYDLQHHDQDELAQLVKYRYDGLQFLLNRADGSAIGYHQSGGVELFENEEEYRFMKGQMEKINQWMQQFLGLEDIYTVHENLAGDYGFKSLYGAIVNRFEGVLDTGLMMKTLIDKARTLDIYLYFGLHIDGFRERVSDVELNISGGLLHARFVLVATNGFAKKLIPTLEVLPARNLVIVTEPLKKPYPTSAGFHLDKGFVYWRFLPDNRLLLGGARNLDFESETTDEFGVNNQILERLLSLKNQAILPNLNAKIHYLWSGIMGIGTVKQPILKMFKKRIGVAVRMGGMGVAIGSLVGDRAAKMIINTAEQTD